ncbi:MAG: hypothetical protein NXH95_02890 [Pseudomonadaceae bacterium]|nr:hypothetical protein [Pseudomonadaceae bacterium]
MSTTPPGQDDRKEPDELIEDLESIKGLFDEEQANSADDSKDEDMDVPLLDDPLVDGLTIDEGLPDDTFKALLDDAWQESVDELLTDARNRIKENSDLWQPEDTDELAQALKIRIDASVKSWLAVTLEQNIGALRTHLVSELSDELLAHLRQKLNKDADTKK